MSPFRRPALAAAAGDPIPFAYSQDTHLFYLTSPAGTLDYPDRVRTSWQHLRSRDLVNWQELPVALKPGPIGAYDSDGVWTGSVVAHGGTFFLFYTGHQVAARNPQTICLATSPDLITFDKHPANPLLGPPSTCEQADWRDPFVFYNDAEHCWWMLIAARRHEDNFAERGCIMLATSQDLLNWQVERDPLYAPGTTYCPECPELWTHGDQWYLVFSRFSEDAGTVYRTAASPRGPFRIPKRDRLGGRRWYAAKSAPTTDGRVFFGWVHDYVDNEDGQRWLWGGDFALPRAVVPRSDRTLSVGVQPGTLAHWSSLVTSRALSLHGIGGADRASVCQQFPNSVLVDIRFHTQDAAQVGFELGEDGEEIRWRVVVDRRCATVTISHEPRPLDDFWADLTARPTTMREVDGPIVSSAPLATDDDLKAIRVEALVDDGLLEVYVNDEVALTHRIGSTTMSRSVSALVVDGEAQVHANISRPSSRTSAEGGHTCAESGC